MTKDGGAEGIRTPDPHNAIVVLYQLSYDPIQSDEILEGGSGLSKQNSAVIPECGTRGAEPLGRET